MWAEMEPHPDLVFRNCDVGRYLDEIAEDLARLGIIIAAHPWQRKV